MEIKRKPNKEKVSISVDADVLQQTILLAQKEDRGLSNYINLVLKQNIENKKR